MALFLNKFTYYCPWPFYRQHIRYIK